MKNKKEMKEEIKKGKCNCRYCQNKKEIESQKWAKKFRKLFCRKVKKIGLMCPAYTEETLLFIYELLKSEKEKLLKMNNKKSRENKR